VECGRQQCQYFRILYSVSGQELSRRGTLYFVLSTEFSFNTYHFLCSSVKYATGFSYPNLFPLFSCILCPVCKQFFFSFTCAKRPRKAATVVGGAQQLREETEWSIPWMAESIRRDTSRRGEPSLMAAHRFFSLLMYAQISTCAILTFM
jgi:hypothetical protein